MKKIISIVLCVCLYLSICIVDVSATFGNTITATFKDTTYCNGKALLSLSIDFPRDETFKYFGTAFNISFSEDGVYLDETGLSNNGKTGATRRVWLYGSDGFVYDDDNNKLIKADWKTGATSSPKYEISVQIHPSCTNNPVEILIPLSIPDTVTGSINVSATNVSSTVHDVSGNVSENVSPVFVSGTIVPGNSTFIQNELVVGEDITNYADKAGATVSGTVDNGTATLNVACDKACTVAYTTDNGDTYTRVDAVQADSGYNFIVPDYTDAMKFVVAVKGDVSGDAKITAADYGALVAAYLGTGSLDSMNTVIGDINADDKITAADYGALVAAYLGTGTIAW